MNAARGRKGRKPRASPRPIRLPLVSSDDARAAFRRLGFIDGPAKGSSHLAMHRPRPGGGHDTISLVLDRKEIPRGTLRGMLETGNVSPEAFVRALK